jgi:hypothetical protein
MTSQFEAILAKESTMSPRTPGSTDGKAELVVAATALTADQRRKVAQFGIGFDGRHYQYRDYHYDRLSDALNYAELESGRPGWQAPNELPLWLEPHHPTAAEEAVMTELAVTFDGKYYLYDGYRYDRCIDAINYAKSKTPG